MKKYILLLLIFLISCDTRHVYYTYQGLPDENNNNTTDISDHIENLTRSLQDETHPLISPLFQYIVFLFPSPPFSIPPPQ